MNRFMYLVGRGQVVDDEDDGDFQMPDLRERIKGSSASVLNMFNGDLGLRRFSGGSCFNGIKGFIILPDNWYTFHSLLLSITIPNFLVYKFKLN